ncbi:DUF6489 family protein [Algiphilus sp.]|uniref:DUF6489 family protein n=1 Tax=Algiphilus sp. TaxID=1872431 RepID=UPI001CA6FFA1|nr:DUF6489 family protein [Algiphilus sp.]MBY8966300.1 hypothetical protein [Algiphilus acroporae]MCI5061513.1 DUF6489 family protein [Algiphilus sp.]MCI5102239.1 DUF6489 family protein [Algiphilus sp.]
MQIRIEIDVKPEELRRFLGLPDVAGLQEDILAYLRDKVGDASETFHPGDFVRQNISSLRKNKAWRKLMDGVEAVEAEEREERRRQQAARKGGARKSGARSDDES